MTLWKEGRRLARAITLERVALAVFVISTAMFIYVYGRLMVEKRQALQERAQARERVAYEEKRRRDLEALFSQSEEDWMVIQEAVRIFGVALPGTVVFRVEDLPPSVRQMHQEREQGEETVEHGVPVWRLWQHTFHLSR